jgi:hypothetical protein
VQDALYDAEEYLRSELAEHPGKSEAEVIASVASSYGAPYEVAEIYRDTEARVQTALRAPKPAARTRARPLLRRRRRSAHLRRAVLLGARAGHGIFYFTWVVTGCRCRWGWRC